MKHFILIFVVTFFVKAGFGQICDLSQYLDLDDSQTERQIEVFGYADLIEISVNYNPREDADYLTSILQDLFERSKLDWIMVYEIVPQSEGKGTMVLYIAGNNTNKVRTVTFRLASTILQIRQLPDGIEPEVFTVSGPTTTLQGVGTPIFLSGSEVDAKYILRCGTTVLDTLVGTGAALSFQTNGQKGTYTVIAEKNGIDRKMGELTLNYYSIASANHSYSPDIYQFEADGGIVDVVMNFPNLDARLYKSELEEIVALYNQGKTGFWDTTIKILRSRYVSEDQFLLTIGAPLHTGKNTIHSAFILNEEVDRLLYIMQQGGGVLTPYHFSGPGYVNAGEKYTLKLSDFQYGVSYLLYKDGAFLRTFYGGDCTELTGFGTYTMKASYEGKTIDMLGTWTVRNKADYSHYTKVTTYMDTTEEVEDIAFYDDLGRPIQQVSKAASPSGKDVIIPIQYDATGRVTRSYLPYTIEGNGTLRKDFQQEQSSFYTALYGANAYACSEVVYDNSPKDQVIEQSSPGASWRLGGGHTVRSATRKNVITDKVVKYIFMDGNVVCSGNWSPGTLSVQQTIDQEQRESYEYYDTEGHIIAKEARLSAGESRFTYYVYDNSGQQRYVLPPSQTATFTSGIKTLSELSALCYYTEYDRYGRIYKQYKPGAGYTITLYDKRGRMVLSQDARQRSQSPETWSFTKYDELNRPIISGICNGTESAHVAALEAQTQFGETRGNALHGYTDQVYPTAVTSDNCLMISYYDDYSWPEQNLVAYSAADALGTVKSDAVTGLQTGQKKKVLGNPTAQWLLSASYYDADYQAVQSVAQLYPSGMEIVTNIHDFTGQVVRTKVKQSVGPVVTEYNKYFTFDPRGRLLKIEQETTGDSQGRVTLAAYTYDELGRRQGKKLHNGLYDANYTYSVAGETTGFTSRDLTWTLSYDELHVPSRNATAKYDGNISCLRWKNGNGAFHAYTYRYDGLGQLLQADYNEQSGTTWSNPSGKYNVGGLSYDDNGNLKTLIRKSASGSDLHNLGYQYNVSNNGNAVGNITLNGQLSGNYVYDTNGNLQTDGYKGYQIVYNELNLPAEISKGSEKISYIYSASGEKLSMQVGSSLTYYRGVMVYNGNTISYMLHPEGTVQRSSNGWIYNYRLTDHIGSTRVLLEKGNSGLSAVQTNEYYPFGLSFANNNLNKNKYLFSGKEYQDGQLGGEMLGLYDFGARYYNPMLGRWFCQDPASQLVSPYGYCGNNPICYVDPDGEWIHIVIGAVIGGIFNVATHWKQLDNFWDGLAAFGIGAGAGALGAATGGAAFASAGGAAFGAGGFMAGAVGGAVGSASMMPAQNLGNAWYFGDPLMSPQEYMLGIASGAFLGGTINGATAFMHGNTFWTGNIRAGKLPAQALVSTKIEAPKPQLGQESPKSLADEIPRVKARGTVLEESTLPPPGKSLTLDPEMGFTRSNFRKGLIELTGNNPGDLAQAHHVFPQKYNNYFSRVGINIHNPKYGAWWTTADHLKNAYNYNAGWGEFFKKPFTSLDVLNEGRRLMSIYKTPINF